MRTRLPISRSGLKTGRRAVALRCRAFLRNADSAMASDTDALQFRPAWVSLETPQSEIRELCAIALAKADPQFCFTLR
jgi:hypothetical protein